MWMAIKSKYVNRNDFSCKDSHHQKRKIQDRMYSVSGGDSGF